MKDVLVVGVDLNKSNITATWLEETQTAERVLLKIVSEIASASVGLVRRIPDVIVQHVSKEVKACTVKIPHKANKRELATYGYLLIRALSDLAYQLNKICVIVLENLYGIERVCSTIDYIAFYRGTLGRYSKLVAICAKPPIEIESYGQWGLLYRVKRKIGALIINPTMTTRLCSRCLLQGEIKEVAVRENRQIECSTHGKLDRDVNASTVIAILGALALADNSIWTLPPPRAGQTCQGVFYQHPWPPPGVDKHNNVLCSNIEEKEGVGVLIEDPLHGLNARGTCTGTTLLSQVSVVEKDVLSLKTLSLSLQ